MERVLRSLLLLSFFFRSDRIWRCSYSVRTGGPAAPGKCLFFITMIHTLGIYSVHTYLPRQRTPDSKISAFSTIDNPPNRRMSSSDEEISLPFRIITMTRWLFIQYIHTYIHTRPYHTHNDVGHQKKGEKKTHGSFIMQDSCDSYVFVSWLLWSDGYGELGIRRWDTIDS